MAPHLIILLNSLKQHNVKYIFRSEFLIEWHLTDSSDGWNFEIMYLNNYDLLELLNHNIKLARILYKKMLFSHPWPSYKYSWFKINTVLSEQQLWFKFKRFEIEYKMLLKSHFKLLILLKSFILLEVVRKIFKRPIYRIYTIDYLRLNKRN
jgi:hypothetical protein